jgi:serine/threonine-protein kinase
MLRYAIQDYKGTLEDANAALKLDGKDDTALAYRGASYYWLDDYAKAVRDINEALAIKKTAFRYEHLAGAYYYLGDYQKAADAATAAIAIDSNDDFALAYRGAAQIYLSNYPAAIKDETAALAFEQAQKRPDAFTYAHLGAAHYFNGEYAAAIDAQAKALHLDPNYAYAHAYLGAAHLKQNRYKEALEDETRAISLDPSSSFALAHRGAARYYLSDFKGAVADERAALHIDPTDAYAKQFLAAAMKQMRTATAAPASALAMHVELLILGAVTPVNVSDKPQPRESRVGHAKKGGSVKIQVGDPEPVPFPGGAKTWPKNDARPHNERKHP